MDGVEAALPSTWLVVYVIHSSMYEYSIYLRETPFIHSSGLIEKNGE